MYSCAVATIRRMVVASGRAIEEREHASWRHEGRLEVGQCGEGLSGEKSHKVRHGRWVVGEGTRIIRRRGREWASETAERVKHSAVERCGCCCDGERVLIRAARRGTETGL